MIHLPHPLKRLWTPAPEPDEETVRHELSRKHFFMGLGALTIAPVLTSCAPMRYTGPVIVPLGHAAIVNTPGRIIILKHRCSGVTYALDQLRQLQLLRGDLPKELK